MSLLLDPGKGHGQGLTCSPPAGRIGSVLGVEVLRHNTKNDATFGIWRVRGSQGSAVVKIAGPPAVHPPATGPAGYWPTSNERTHWNYWQRESLAYRTGLTGLALGDSGIAAPEVLAANTRPDGLVELWLADVAGPEGFAWPVAGLARFAYQLGAGQARWAGRVPETAWLSRRWLGQYLTEGPVLSVRPPDDAAWRNPRVAIWPEPVRHGLQRLWTDRGRVLAAAEAGPRTLCHLDVWPANLIGAEGRSVLLDWSFVGEGAIGEDLSNLIIDSFTDGLMDPSLLPELAQSATDSYLDGLRDGGWSGSPDEVRRAIAACGAAKYSWFGPAVLRRIVENDFGTSSYSKDDDPEKLAERVLGLLTLIADWSGTVLG